MKRAPSRVLRAHARPAHTTLNHTRPRRHQSRPSRQTGPPRRHPPGPGGCRPEATSSADAGTRAGHALTCTGRDFGHASRACVVRARPTWLRRPAAAPPQVLHVCPPASAGAPPAPGQSLRVHAKNDSRGIRRDVSGTSSAWASGRPHAGHSRGAGAEARRREGARDGAAVGAAESHGAPDRSRLHRRHSAPTPSAPCRPRPPPTPPRPPLAIPVATATAANHPCLSGRRGCSGAVRGGGGHDREAYICIYMSI